jgi:hypothetical protein
VHPRWLSRALCTFGALLVLWHAALALGRGARLAPFVDEAEFLHQAWLQAGGQRPYRDFFQNHSPFLPAILQLAMPAQTTPEFPTLDVPRLLWRGRAFALVCGLITLLALAGVTLRAAGGMPLAVLLVWAGILGSKGTWDNAIFQVRHEPPVLALFWAGALAVLAPPPRSAGRALVCGVGMGLVAVAFLWAPKWPLETAVIGGLFLYRLWQARARAIPALLGAVAVAGAAILWLSRLADWRDYVFFVGDFNRNMVDRFAHIPFITTWFRDKPAWTYCPSPCAGIGPALAFALVLASCAVPQLRGRLTRGQLRLRLLLLLLAATSLCEVRFLYPYPYIWSQYFLMWSTLCFLLYGCALATVWALLRDPLQVRIPDCVQLGVGVAAVLATMVQLRANIKKYDRPAYWAQTSRLQQRLRPGETVWLPPDLHPIGAADASYYWCALNDLIPVALTRPGGWPAGARLPALGEQDLPPCRLAHGGAGSIRFVADVAQLSGLPLTSACWQETERRGRIGPSGITGIWEVVPGPS